MANASYDLCSANCFGNFDQFNAIPGEAQQRSRLIKCSASYGTGISTLSAGCAYRIFKIPSYYLVKRVDVVIVGSCSEAGGGWITIGDGDASTTWFSVIGCSKLGSPSLTERNASLQLGLSAFGPSHFINGKFYSNGGEIQMGATSAEGTAQFWVTVEAVNLTPV
jgi:hypothetical protein